MTEKRKAVPPKFFLRLFEWFCHPKLHRHIEGDLMELYDERVRKSGERHADLRFIVDVILLCRPGIIRPAKMNANLNTYAMFKSYFKIAWRNLTKDQGYSFINIGGLALGVTVGMLIGLWIYDEWSYDKHQENYNDIAIVLQNNTMDGNIETWSSQSYQLGPELRNSFGNKFKYVAMSSFPESSILSDGEKIFTAGGCFMESDGPQLLSLTMIKGTRTGLQDPTSILLSASVANVFFGDEDPIGKVLKVANEVDLKVAGVYQDMPDNSTFKDGLAFIAPLDVLVNRGGRNLGWVNNWLQVYVQVAENVDMKEASAAIKDVKKRNVDKSELGFNPVLFLHPMPRWHLYSGFKNGVNTGGHIESVVLFGAIGVFVVLLACINFMNLSTARYQKRAKEVGVRKVIGSARNQLIGQFFCESLFVVLLAFVFSFLLVQLFLPWFNEIAGKNLGIPWTDTSLWLLLIVFSFVVTLVSSMYPALYLSSFRPISVLKGTFRAGQYAFIPRKVLVVVQFAISVTLIIGTTVVYQQIEFARNRPVGYDLDGLITIPMKTAEVKKSYEALRNDLLAGNIVSELSTSETTITNLWWSDKGFQWKGKDPNFQDMIYRGAVSYEFGKTVGWKIKEGRDFSRNFRSDSSAIILNEAAVKYMGLETPIGETIKTAYGLNYTVIGVVEDMVTQSIFQPSKQTYFILDRFHQPNFINVKINPQSSAGEALAELNKAFVKHNSETPFEYAFASEEFAEKFSFEQRTGKLVGFFAVLAIFISCLGLFGLASFVTEQRTKEIGVRKVLGASVFNLWRMLSKEFVGLVVIAVFIASPVAYYFMSMWLEQYVYRTELAWWTFVVSGMGALVITLCTVSYQSIKSAKANPVTSLRSE